MGIEERALERVYAPIGLYLGAETPQEIALSIMAEIMALRNDVEPLRHRCDTAKS